MTNVQKIIGKDSRILAIVVKTSKINEGLTFLTPEHFGIQAGIHNKQAGYIVKPHKHPPLTDIKSLDCQEAFFLESGRMQIDIYGTDDKLVQSVIMEKGDLIILNCGHGVTFLEDAKMIEIRQGPYRSKEYDKIYIE